MLQVAFMLAVLMQLPQSFKGIRLKVLEFRVCHGEKCPVVVIVGLSVQAKLPDRAADE